MADFDVHGIAARLTVRTIGNRDTIALKDALEAGLPSSVASYLRAETARALGTELTAAPRFAALRAAPTGSHLVGGFLDSLAPECIFGRDEFITLLSDAVHFAADYLTRPRKTLEHFLLAGEETAAVGELLDRLRYLSAYTYLPSLIARAVQRKGWARVYRADLHTLVQKLDDQVVQQHTPRELGFLTRPLFEFITLEKLTEHSTIPVGPLLSFFDDKQMLSLQNYIDRMCQIRGRDSVTMPDLIGIIEDLEPSSLATPVEPPPGPAGPPPESLSLETGAPAHAQQMAEPGPIDAPSKINSSDTAETPAVPPELRITQAGPPLPRIEDTITDEQRQRFVRKLFKKDDDYLAAILVALNRSSSWRDASLYLHELYELNGLDPYSDEVIEFTDAIHRRYYPESGKR